jgi:hypothetical protein
MISSNVYFDVTHHPFDAYLTDLIVEPFYLFFERLDLCVGNIGITN